MRKLIKITNLMLAMTNGNEYRIFAIVGLVTLACSLNQPTALAQNGVITSGPQLGAAQPESQNSPIAVTLQDAIRRAKDLDVQYRAAVVDAGVAHEDHVQSRSALLPSLTYNNEYLYTEGTGSSIPRFIANNTVHEYISQGNAHEVVSGTQIAEYRRTLATEAVAKAKLEIATRGLTVAVVRTYYAEIVARQKYASAQLGAGEARRFYDLSQRLEQGGEVVRADVIKAQLQLNELQRTLQEAQLEMDRSHVELAVLIFPTFNQDFSTIDDLGVPPSLPALPEIAAQAQSKNPDLYAALQAFKAAGYGVLAARAEYLPSLSVDYFYGIDAGQFAVNTLTPDGRIRNLGYSASATLNIPIWNWGATHSKVRQAELRRQQSQTELSAAQRRLLADLKTLYLEAQTARSQLDQLQQSAELAADQVRLTNLRYQAGEATALEVVDAQNTLIASRNNYDDGQARYRLSIANLQTLTGAF
jgi:outer membrane protein TolC